MRLEAKFAKVPHLTNFFSWPIHPHTLINYLFRTKPGSNFLTQYPNFVTLSEDYKAAWKCLDPVFLLLQDWKQRSEFIDILPFLGNIWFEKIRKICLMLTAPLAKGSYISRGVFSHDFKKWWCSLNEPVYTSF